MYFYKTTNTIISVIILLSTTNVSANTSVLFDKLPNKKIAHFLGWTPDPKANNLCGGYYKEPKIVLEYHKPAPAKSEKITITAKKQAFYSV